MVREPRDPPPKTTASEVADGAAEAGSEFAAMAEESDQKWATFLSMGKDVETFRKGGFRRACLLGVEGEDFLVAEGLERFKWFFLLERSRRGVEA